MQKKHKFIIGLLIIFLFGSIAGFAFSNSKSNQHEQSAQADKLMQYCKDELLPAYEAGFMSSLIKDMDVFARQCEGDVKGMSWYNIRSELKGFLLLCDSTNTTYTFYLPDESDFR